MSHTNNLRKDGTRKVLVIVENLSVPFDRRVWRECTALRDAGYQVSVISPKGVTTDHSSRAMVDGVSIYRYRSVQAEGGSLSYMVEYGVAVVMSLWLSALVYYRDRFDVVQICNPPDLLIIAVLPFKLLGKKIIFDQHDLCPEIYQTQKGMGTAKNAMVRILLWCEKVTYWLSDIVIVVNASCKKIAMTRGNKEEKDIFIVRNGPSLSNTKMASSRPELKHGKRYLLSYVGIMGKQEGVDILLRAIRLLSTEYNRNDFHVHIMGGGPVLEPMKRYAIELGVSGLITFAGYVDYRAVMEGIATADVCLCPDPKTPLSDKCSLVKTIEYMSLGKPFVAFDLEEVHASAGPSALYALPNDERDFAEKVNIMLDDEPMRVRMGNMGRERFINECAWEHSQDALYAAYDRAFVR